MNGPNTDSPHSQFSTRPVGLVVSKFCACGHTLLTFSLQQFKGGLQSLHQVCKEAADGLVNMATTAYTKANEPWLLPLHNWVKTGLSPKLLSIFDDHVTNAVFVRSVDRRKLLRALNQRQPRWANTEIWWHSAIYDSGLL